MSDMKYLTEAFRELEMLDEDVFDADDKGIEELDDFLSDSEESEDFVDIVDSDADTEDELQDNYVGKVILQCCVCHTMNYKDKADVKIDKASELANVDEECPFCFTTDGFTIVGEVAPFSDNVDNEPEIDVTADDDVEVEVEEKDSKDNKKNESLRRHRRMKRLQESTRTRRRKKVSEDLNNISLDTENEHITITSEPRQDDFGMSDNFADDTMIVPVDDETEDDIIGNSNEDIDDFDSMPEEDNFADIDDLDTDSFDEMEEAYLKSNYSNVKSYKTTKIVEGRNNKICIEGIVRFRSGRSKKVRSIYEAKYGTKSGKVMLEGIRTQSDEKGKTVRLVGRIKGKSIVTESLKNVRTRR